MIVSDQFIDFGGGLDLCCRTKPRFLSDQKESFQNSMN